LGDRIHISDSSLKYIITKPKQFELDVQRPKGHIQNGDIVYTEKVEVDIPISKITSHDINDSFTLVPLNWRGVLMMGYVTSC